MPTELWTSTPPTERGYFWWRLHGGSTPRIRRVYTEDGEWRATYASCDDNMPLANVPGLWGPRIDPPIAAPVEQEGILDSDGVWWFGTVTIEDFRADRDADAKLYRGVFMPTEIVPQDREGSDDDR